MRITPLDGIDVLGWFDDADVRQALYWNLFSGGFGHTYGCHPIWQMLAPGREAIGLARHNWFEVINLPGAWDLIHARRLMESRPFLSRVPDQSLIIPSYYPETDYIVATRGEGYAMVYFPTGWDANIQLEKLGAKVINAWWFNPRNGETNHIGQMKGEGTKLFSTPTKGRSNDWVLILDDTSKQFKAPGLLSID